MSRTWRRVLALLGLFVLAIVVAQYVTSLVPTWLDRWITLGFVLAFFAVVVVLANRWWPDKPLDRSPHRVDPGSVPLPSPGSARRIVITYMVLGGLALAITAGIVAILLALSRGSIPPPNPDDGPLWYQFTIMAGVGAAFALITLVSLYQSYRARGAALRIPHGLEPRWHATVLRERHSTLSVAAVRVDHEEGPPRLVRFSMNSFVLEPLRPGDELVMDGSLRRGDVAAVTVHGQTIWVMTGWRVPKSQPAETIVS